MTKKHEPPRTDGRMRLAVDPETTGAPPAVTAVEARCISGSQVEVLLRFAQAMPESTELTLQFGQLLVHAPGGRRIALQLEDSGLWRAKWHDARTERQWLDQGRTARLRLTLPAPYEQVTDQPAFQATQFPECAWTIMTTRQWLDAVDRHG